MENERKDFTDHDLLVRLDERMGVYAEQIKSKASIEQISELKEFITYTIRPVKDQLETTVKDVVVLKSFKESYDSYKSRIRGVMWIGGAIVGVVIPIVYIVVEGAVKKLFNFQ